MLAIAGALFVGMKHLDQYFAISIATGVALTASSMIPLSLDDKGSPEDFSMSKATSICMSVPWVTILGFAMIQAGLYSKVAKTKGQRFSEGLMGLMIPTVTLVLVNGVVLLIWSVVDPLTYIRTEGGVDPWGRINDTFGKCQANNASGFWLTLAIINLCFVLFTHWELHHVRRTNASGGLQRVGWASSISLQLLLTGLLLLFVARDSPAKYYLVFSVLLFVGLMAIVAVLFVPPFEAAEADEEPKVTKDPATSVEQAPAKTPEQAPTPKKISRDEVMA